ncbi:hypothetical protein O8E93_003614 [Aeromonas salmonicida]|nr:hypothetical protein [Aeromonas salmonicida]
MSPILLADRWTGKKGSLVHLVSTNHSGVYRQNQDELVWAGLLPLVSLDGVIGELAPIRRSHVLQVIAMTSPNPMPTACAGHDYKKERRCSRKSKR